MTFRQPGRTLGAAVLNTNSWSVNGTIVVALFMCVCVCVFGGYICACSKDLFVSNHVYVFVCAVHVYILHVCMCGFLVHLNRRKWACTKKVCNIHIHTKTKKQLAWQKVRGRDSRRKFDHLITQQQHNMAWCDGTPTQAHCRCLCNGKKKNETSTTQSQSTGEKAQTEKIYNWDCSGNLKTN